MHRPALASLFVLCTLLVAGTTPAHADSQTPAAAQPAASAEPNPPRGLIEQSWLIAPRSVGAFRLIEHSYDPAHKAAGAMFRYQALPEPDTIVDVFVYPAGQGTQATLLEAGMRDFRRSLKDAERAGYFDNVKIGDDSRFALDPAAPAYAKPAKRRARQDADAVIQSALAEQQLVGQRMLMTMQTGQSRQAIRSAGYLFYKNMYFYKVRISIPEVRMDASTFAETSDHAARSLVNGIDVLNVGDCSKVAYINPKANENQLMQQLISQVMARQGDNCSQTLDAGMLEEKRRLAETVLIEFDADDWRSR
ncbi:MAG: hypothetical protein Q4G62_09390 [Pseudomonadota bacterium]|nr:hypothetical protein [Pseudomonadota bacterium]